MASAVYWVGQDGNYYYGSGEAGAGVQNLGYAGATNPNIDIINGATRIPDPALASGATSAAGVGQDGSALTSTGGSAAPSGGTSKPLNQAAVSNTQATIDQIPGLLSAALAAEGQTHANTNSAFDAQEQSQRGQYGAGTTTNQQNYDSNFMDSIRAGIHGLGGLISLLRGSGAAGGTAEDLAHQTVGGVTANDIRTGADTQKENQGQLDSSLSTFLTDLKGKRQANEDTFANNNSAIRRDSNTQLQDLYGKMAGFYGDAGDTGDANSWMARAGALTPQIAADSRTQVSPYDTSPIIVHAPNLTAFAPPSQPQVATAPTDGQVGSGIFTMNSTKRKDTTTPVAAGA